MSPRSSAARRRAALAAAFAVLTGTGCGAPDARRPGSYDPRAPVLDCLRDEGVAAQPAGKAAVLAGAVRIEFLTTPGQAVARQISGQAQGAEQIGGALVWVGRASDELLATVEECVDR